MERLAPFTAWSFFSIRFGAFCRWILLPVALRGFHKSFPPNCHDALHSWSQLMIRAGWTPMELVREATFSRACFMSQWSYGRLACASLWRDSIDQPQVRKNHLDQANGGALRGCGLGFKPLIRACPEIVPRSNWSWSAALALSTICLFSSMAAFQSATKLAMVTSSRNANVPC